MHVILADHAIAGNDVENAKSIDLGDLTGNTGNQNTRFRRAFIWPT